jgi:hypothetical protein
MRSVRVFALVAVLVSVAGCGSKDAPTADSGPPAGYSGSKSGPPGGTSKLTLDNLKRIQIGGSTLDDARQTFGGPGEMTNDEKPGLGMGSKWMWKDGERKVYVSIGIDGKATGAAWEGFDGR